ncbi:MAG: response regulator transcription factor [Acidobacteria bacterium]|jgi:two-component system KDP operon response regulator KdpE|nr:response regulator transcription factor [Acidobacteriota bacterium]
MSANILIVDDDPQILRMLRTSLQASGYAVNTALSGGSALSTIAQAVPDLLITDIAMPGMDGIELTKRVRETHTLPIIVLSVRDNDEAKVQALDEGADDYVTKPFRTPELLARVRAQLRRSQKAEDAPHPVLHVGHFEIDQDSHTVTMRGEHIHLSPKEFDLLLLFAKAPQKVLTHKSLLRAIWGVAGANQPEYLRVLVAQLRKKIETEDSKYIQSEPWVGYRFNPEGRDELL